VVFLICVLLEYATGKGHSVCLSVCLSARLSVTLKMYFDNLGVDHECDGQTDRQPLAIARSNMVTCVL